MTTLPVVDIPSGHSFYCPTLPDDAGRDKGEDVAGSTKDTRASPDCRSGNKAKRRKELQQKNSTNFDISDSQRRIGTLESTTERRLDHESVGLSAFDRVKSVSGECSSGMDGVFVMRSSLETHDRPGRYSVRECLDMMQLRSTPPCPGSGKTMRFQQTLDMAAVNIHNAEEWWAYRLLRHHLFHCLCPRARRHNLQRFRPHKWASNQSARRTASACGKFQPTHNKTTISCWSNSSLFRLLESKGRRRSAQFFSCIPTNRRRTWSLNKSRNCRVSCKFFGNVSVGSCFLMEIDIGCPQPPVYDDSSFGEYLGTIAQNNNGTLEPALEPPLDKRRESTSLPRYLREHVTMMCGFVSRGP